VSETRPFFDLRVRLNAFFEKFCLLGCKCEIHRISKYPISLINQCDEFKTMKVSENLERILIMASFYYSEKDSLVCICIDALLKKRSFVNILFVCCLSVLFVFVTKYCISIDDVSRSKCKCHHFHLLIFKNRKLHFNNKDTTSGMIVTWKQKR